MTGNSNRSPGVWLWIAAIVVISSLPYLFLAAGSDGERYDWLLPPYAEDGLGYTSWVKQAATGSILLKLKFTQIPHSGVVFNPFFLVVGWLSAITGWQAGLALFAARIVAVAVFLLTLYRFSSRLFDPGPQRAVGLALVTLSSGLGLRLGSSGMPTADLWMPEINTLWSLAWNPVFVVALTLMVATIGLVSTATARGAEGLRLGPLFAAGGLTALLAFTHAYDVLVVGAVVFLVIALRLRRAMIRPLLAYAALALPAVLVQWLIATYHPLLAAHSARGLMSSPSILSYAAAMGVPGAFAVYGAWRIFRTGAADRFLPLLLWVPTSLALSFSPVWFQRKLIMGIHIPVCLIAAVGVCELARRASFGRRTWYAVVVVAILAVSSTTHVQNAQAIASEVRRDRGAYYLPASLGNALLFLDEQTQNDEVVMAHYYAARHVPGVSGNTVTLGHWAQSVDLDSHMRWIGGLFGAGENPTVERRRDALLGSPIRYVLIERRMRTDWMRGTVPLWLDEIGETIYDRDDIRIIELRRPAQSPD